MNEQKAARLFFMACAFLVTAFVYGMFFNAVWYLADVFSNGGISAAVDSSQWLGFLASMSQICIFIAVWIILSRIAGKAAWGG